MEVYFKPSDIVWVKLGPFWWPGEVVDKTKVPEEVTDSLKKEPVAIVKFFDDNEYFECVKTSDHIYHYNCERKNGFIKKGMDAFRSNNPKLASFPKDVSTAEVKTGGNANILSNPMFIPERKRSYGETFGSPSPKKSKNGNKNRLNKSAPIITHRRFLGYDDYESHVLIQFPGKDKESEDQNQTDLISEEPFARFTCPVCQFVTDKLGILTVHTQGHVKDVVDIPGPHIKKTPKRKKKKAVSDDESGDAKKTKTKRKYKKKGKADQSSFADDERSGNDTSVVKDIPSGEIEHPTLEKKDVFNDIIADWDDESNQDNTEEIDASALDSSTCEINTSIEITVNEASITTDTILDSTFDPTEEGKFSSTLVTEESDETGCLETTETTKPVEKKKEKDTNISCFDFDESEEDTRIPDATSGRKIPRVIPLSDKRKSFNFEDNLVEDEEEEIRKKILNESIQLSKVGEAEEKDKETEDLENTYKSLMDSTSKIELPEIPNILKSEQNFHCAKTVKYPDKDDDAKSSNLVETEENIKISEVIESVPNIEKVGEESNHSKIVNDASLSIEEQYEKKNQEDISAICSIIGVNNETFLEGLKVKNEASSMKSHSKDLKEQKEAIIENKCEKQLIDSEEAPNTIVTSKRKFETIKEGPEDSVVLKQKPEEKIKHVEIEKVSGNQKKRSRKSKVCSEDVAENIKSVEDSLVTVISGNTQIEQTSSERLNRALEVEPENIKVSSDSDKSKIKSKKETGKKKKGKKDKKPLYKRHIDESEIDKLLAKYSADPIRDDEESDYCSSELVTENEVIVDSSVKGISENSDEVKQQISEAEVANIEKSDLIISEEKTVIEADVKNVTPEPKSSTIALSDADNSEQQLNFEKSHSEITPSAKMDSTEDSKSTELLAEEQVETSGESSMTNLVSDICTEQIITEVEFKEETMEVKDNKTEGVTVKEKAPQRSSRRHKSSCGQKDEHAVISTLNSESITNVEGNLFDDNKLKDKHDESDSQVTGPVNSPQISETCKEDSKVVEQDIQHIPVASSSSSVVKPEPNDRQSVKRDRKSSKDHKKESSEREKSSSGKRETDAQVASRRSRWDRRSKGRYDVNPVKTTTDDGEKKSETVTIDDNISKRDSNRSGKEKLLKDPHESGDTTSAASKAVSSSSSKNSKKSDKNEKEDAERNSTSQKESHKNSRSLQKSSRSIRENKNSSRKHDSVEDVSSVIGQIQEPIVPHRNSRSKSHHTDQTPSKKDEQNSLPTTNAQIDDKNKRKEKPVSTSHKEDRKSKGNRRSSKYDHENLEFSMESYTTKNEHSKKDDNKDISSSHPHSKIDKLSHKDLDKSSHSKMIHSDVRGENILEFAHGSSSHRTYRKSRERSDKYIDSLKIEKLNAPKEKEVKSSPQNYKSSKKERLDKDKHSSLSIDEEKDTESHRNNRKDSKSKDEFNKKKQNDSKFAVSAEEQQLDESLVNLSDKHDTESKKNEGKMDEFNILPNVNVDHEKQEILHDIKLTENDIKKIQIDSDEKINKTEVIVCQENQSEKCSELNISLSCSGNDEQLKPTAQLDAIQKTDIDFDEKPSSSEILSVEKIAEVSFVKDQSLIEASSLSPISSKDQDLTNLISAIVGADSTQEVDQINKNEGIEELSDPISNSPSKQISSCNETKEEKDSNDTVCQMASISDSSQKTISNFQSETSSAHKQELPVFAPQTSRRNRKPSRWDQKERPNINIDKKPRVSRWDQGNQDQPKSNISDIIEKLDIVNNVDNSLNIPHSESDPNLESENLDDTVSQSDTSIVSQREAEQIELIFGSSPLPKPNEDNLFAEEDDNKLQESEIIDFVQKKDPKKIFMMKSKLSEPLPTSEEKNKEKATFECSSAHLPIEPTSDDLMESVESQVARITHYEEPNSEETIEQASEDDKEKLRKDSLFDTPEKKEKFSKSIFDTPEDKIKVDSATPESKSSIEKKRPRLLEADLLTQKPEATEERTEQEKIAPKSKKNYLLVEKSKLEKMEKPPETSTLHPQSSSKSTSERTDLGNEVATKLTNPKKRFVKSFEDFELNKQKKKSADASRPAEDKVTKGSTVSGLVGKSPIVFKLKKQFLSKISNVFDEENEVTSPIKTKPTPVGPSISPKAKGINLLGKEENKMSVSKNDSINYMTDKETEEQDKKPPPLEDSEISLSKSLLKESHELEEPQVKSVVQTEIKTCSENEKQKVFEENSSAESSSHKVHFTADINSPVEFTIDTNLSNIDKPEELSTLSELVDIPVIQSEIVKEVEDGPDDSKTEIITKNFPLENKKEELEFVPIDGNLTLVSEKELEEGQVEITASMSTKKTVNLMNFSMDFSDDSDTGFEVLKKENIRCITESLDVTKNLEDEQKVVIDDNNTKHFIENTPKESATKKLDVEDTFENTIIAQLDLNFGDNAAMQKEDHQNITIDTVLKTGEIKKNVSAEIIPSKVQEMTTIAKTLNRISDAAPIKEPEKVVSAHSSKRSDQKTVPKAKVVAPPLNEPLVIYNTVKSSTITDTCDLEDHIPSQIVCTKNALTNEEVMKVAGIGNESTKEGSLPKIEPTISKLLSRLTGDKTKEETPKTIISEIECKKAEIDSKSPKVETSAGKHLIKSSIKGKNPTAQTFVGVTSTKSGNKAIILSEKIIRPARDAAQSNVPLKRSYEDVEDIKPYVISKTQKVDNKKVGEKTVTSGSKITIASSTKLSTGTTSKLLLTNPNKQTIGLPKFSGKAKILNQTIIRPAGEIQQAKAVSNIEDNVDFDINSMPIVLSDELLTAESLENMPIVLGDNVPKSSASEKMKIFVDKKEAHNTAKILNNSVTMPSLIHSPTLKMPQIKKTSVPKILQTSGQPQRIIRQAASTRPGKYIIVPENTSKSIQMKKPNIVRRSLPLSGLTGNPPNITPETTGHKIMIVTNQQGQQQRLLLTPAHQKMFGMQLPKAGKTMMKSAVTLKTPVGKVQTTLPSNLTSTSKVQGISSPKFIKAPVSSGQILSPQMKLAPPRKVQKVYMPHQQTAKSHTQKTILIKNQQGQTVRKIQGADEALLDKQVAEQLEAIKVSSLKSQQRQQELIIKTTSINKPSAIANRKAYSKRPEFKQNVIAQPKMSVQSTSNTSVTKQSEQIVPPLAPIKVDKKSEETKRQLHEVKPIENKPLDRPLNQLVIQDNMGNQTTVTEGQILALPSETVDGQPQSYMLVTLDESGNLTPLNNEALMSLDPSLAGLTGGDLSNMVLQLDPGIAKDAGSHTAQLQAVAPVTHMPEKFKPEQVETSRIVHQEIPPKPLEQVLQPVEQTTAQVQVTCNINGEPSQQIILTGDPLATQKFLDSLSEGNTELANILANAEGSSFLIQADGQQILINTEPTDAQMLQANSNVAEQPEQGNPMFATHPVKNQDILAAALADTDVFQQEQVSNQNKGMHSQLSPGQTLFPMNVGNVLETSLTLNSPIMTPLEVPSTNAKKIIDAESDILSARVSKNVDLPITITDPNISQTVSHQQVLMASDLQTSLELTLPISETAMSVTSGMNSPSFVYSLPNLGVVEHTEVNQKSFSSSMPLLTEDIEETPPIHAAISKEGNESSDSQLGAEVSKHGLVDSLSDKRPGIITSDGTFIEEGLCTLGGEMCSSLSEPPPEMFDIPISNDGLNFLTSKAESGKENLDASVALTPELLTDENSMEIPVQPQIVADLKDPPYTEDSFNSATRKKECKLD